MARYNSFAETLVALSAIFLPLALTAVALRIAALGLSTQSSKWSSKRGGLDVRNEISGQTKEKAKHYRNLGKGNSDDINLTSISPGDRFCSVNGTKDYSMRSITIEDGLNVG